MRLVALFSLLLSLPGVAGTIDFGQANDFSVFVEKDFQANSADTQGRVAVGGDFTIGKRNSWGGYDIGEKINQFNLNTGPALVVGGNVKKVGSGTVNIYGNNELVYAGKLSVAGNANRLNATTSKLEKNQLPVNFDDTFAHLRDLSANLAAQTQSGTKVKVGNALVFTPSQVTTNGVYVFNITHDDFHSNYTELKVDGVQDNATIVFNITNPNGIKGPKNWNGKNCPKNDPGCVQIAGLTPIINGQRHVYTDPHSLEGRVSQQVLFNFPQATQVNLAANVYATILAPHAAINAQGKDIYGQVMASSWEGTMQVNYDPFNPVGNTDRPTAEVSEPHSAFLFSVMLLILVLNRKRISQLLPANPTPVCS